jgi:alpha-glucosidase
MAGVDEHLWWQRGIIYQIYPRSFADSDGDGVGDLPGILGRLDYLEWLGINAVWLSPIYPSPMVDSGYDVADYTAVDPIFGSLEDLDALIVAAHGRGLKVILDLVPNHTSDQHPWFTASRSSRTDARRDWYLWRDPTPDGGPPNNWLSHFGGSAWQWDPGTGQYYYHAFAVEQPDLNWRNPRVRAAVFDVMRFWLDRGIDGFRVDVMWQLIKDAHLRNNPVNPKYTPEMSPYESLVPAYSADQAGVHEVVAQMRAVLDEYDERLMIGEIYLPVGRLVNYYGHAGEGANLPFNFHLVLTRWDAREIGVVIDRYEGVLPSNAWPNWVLGNHDQPRVVSRIGPEQARVAAVLLLTLRGTPTIYYGEELGMHDVPIPPDRAHDPRELNQPGRGLGRDPYRTPMQWNAEPGGGFTQGAPWLPLAPDHDLRNVEAQREDPDSMLRLYRRLIDLRRAEPALSVGSYAPVPASGNLLAYLRCDASRRLLVALTLDDQPARLPLGALGGGEVLIGLRSHATGDRIDAELELEGDDAVVVALDPPSPPDVTAS